MNTIKVPIESVIVLDRQRLDLGNIPELATSLSKFGLIQPIVVNQENRLIAGGRRLEAAKSLGWTEISVVYKETLSADELHEMELEENVRRKQMTWQERCLNIAKIHSLKRARSTEPWGMAETGELLGVSKTHTHYCLTIAKELRSNPQSPMWQCESMADAWKLVLRAQEDAALAELARRQQEATFAQYADQADGLIETATVEDVSVSEARDDRERARSTYLQNPHNDPADFDSYWEEKQRGSAERLEVRLSNRLYNMDCLEFMALPRWKGVFDHIITDIPYGQDMDNLDTLQQVDTVEKEHEVSYVRDLMTQFFPLAYSVLKDNAFLATWCDIELWQFMYDLAIKAGFKVQRWPVTWNKTHTCRNNAAQYNYTKTTEIAMVCRKGVITLCNTSPTSVVTCSNDDLSDAIRHPFAKPKAAWDFLVRHISIPGQLIYEPFAGGGSGVISMLQEERNVIATEKVEAHYNELLENVKQLHYLKLNPNFFFT